MRVSVNAAAAAFDVSPTVADRVAAYGEWRVSCASVWEAYRHWSSAPKADEELAHAAYAAALDREDAAASAYSRISAPMEHCDRGRVRGSEDRPYPRST
jgi:hypothetical protein